MGIEGIGSGMLRKAMLLSGSNMLAWLGHVAKVDLVGIWTVLGGQGIGEAGPRAVVPTFDGGQPGGFDRVTCSGMEVCH